MARFLRRALAGVLGADELGMVVSAFDQMGDIAVIRIPETLYGRRHDIGEALLSNIKVVRGVFCQVSDVSGEYRTRSLERIAGEGGTVTEYKENGCRFVIDVERVFFTPRLSTERARVAGLVKPGDIVLNMFGGAGPYSIQAAKRVPCTVYSIDANPEATALCAKNADLNRLAGEVVAITGDAMESRDLVPCECDRTIMPLPERSAEFAAAAVRATRDGGTIHYYSHIHADSKRDAAGLAGVEAAGAIPCQTEVLRTRLVRAVGPRYYQTVADVCISK